MKGIILAGGAGSRLFPMTKVITKQLQPVYDKPMIYYPLSFLMLGGMREIMMITTEHDLPHFQSLLGNGENLGIKISYKVQPKPNGLPEAFVLAEDFLAGQDACLILGDNLFYGDIQFFRDALDSHKARRNGQTAQIFAYSVADPRPYGVVEFDKKTKSVKSIEEKPQHPKSNFAIPGLYLVDGTASARAKGLKPSPRGETEIVELIRSYQNDGKLGVEMITRGVAWLDTGTPRSLVDASNYICAIEERQGLKVACLEEVAYRMKFIDSTGFRKTIDLLPNSPYRQYLERLWTDLAGE